MARIEIIKEAKEDSPRSVECLEILVWGVCGHQGQEFSIGSGANFNASGNFWLEIRYSLQDIPLFYTRNILHYLGPRDVVGMDANLQKFLNEEFTGFGFGDMLPETSILLTRRKFSYPDSNDETHESTDYTLKISADMGAVFGSSPPGERMVDFRFEYIELEEGLRFIRELIREVSEAASGHHPDPAAFPPGHSEWPFALRLNCLAYDQISTGYQESYFSDPTLAEAFDGWLAELPASGYVLDAGCGHGDPVIARLLEKGFQVTGSDLSPLMLARAREQFPAARFWEKAITEIDVDSIFDGACSFSSMLYLDPIDFFHSIYRLYRALTPGGLLFLCGFDLHPGWRGEPYHVDLNHWMWGETYGKDETVHFLEEHGYFKVLKTVETGTEADRQERIERWREQSQKEYEKATINLPPEFHLPAIEISANPARVAYPYIVIAQKQEK